MLDIKLSELELLHKVFVTGSLSESAQESGMPVSTASRTLKKLQEQFSDPLFVRTWKGLVPTRVAKALMPTVEELLHQAKNLETKKIFDPALLDTTISIACADNALLEIVQPVVRRIIDCAPNVSFRFTPLNSQFLGQLATGEIDFALAPYHVISDLPQHYFGIPLFSSSYAYLVDKSHPLAREYIDGKSLCKDDFRSYPKVVVHLRDCGKEALYDLDDEGFSHVKRTIEVPYFLGAPFFIPGTLNTLLLPGKTAQIFAKMIPNLIAIPVHHHDDENVKRLLWHERNHDSSAMQWVRSLFVEYAAPISHDDLGKSAGINA